MEPFFSAERLQRYREFARFPAWSGSHISMSEGRVLVEMMANIKPKNVVEIGVNTGCSTAVLAWALREIHGSAWRETQLHAFDIAKFCTAVPGQEVPVGQAVREMDPGLVQVISLHPEETALDAASHLPEESVDFAFIDAGHNHPWPTLDLLALLPLLRPGAWVGLHDITLSESRQGVYRHGRVRGPAVLFQTWRGVKRDGATLEPATLNLGFLQLPAHRNDAKDWIVASLTEEWDVAPPYSVLRKLHLHSQHCGLQNGYLISLLEHQVTEGKTTKQRLRRSLQLLEELPVKLSFFRKLKQSLSRWRRR